MNLKNVDYHLIDRCNLNCVSCGHFCPLVPKDTKGVTIDQAFFDLMPLYRITNCGDNLDQLTLTGGEVTINDELPRILELAVGLFPNKVKMWSNGINYKKLIDLKDIINKGNVQVCITNYLFKNEDEIIAKLRENINNFYYISRGDEVVKFNKQFFDPKVTVSDYRIFNCEARQYCIQLVDGKLYPCQYAAYWKYLKSYFGDKLQLELEGTYYIDLNDYNLTFDKLISKLSTMKFSICNHCIDCDPNYRVTQDWRISDKDMSEWIR